ncbi:ribonuclease G [Lacticaseibacillus nasuensis]|uniref:ribonuclease G n=1 Tax=Lacticaseibacillus nasuensis TaxID=944671 RepID=UPI00224548F1|nr:ribonuclease G [Lacticaseibacillus nasuensis]MCX2455214.1 ribonuclease G [Lacticaseibacillus nasuensis]
MNTPEEIKHWNWGAFMFNWIWGIGNKSYLPLLCLIPVFNLVWVFFCGAKGNEWAWEKGDYKDVETFMAVQKTWNRAGLVQFIIFCSVIAIYIIFFVVIGAAIFGAVRSGYSN